MQVWNRAPLPNASPLPRNRTLTPATLSLPERLARHVSQLDPRLGAEAALTVGVLDLAHLRHEIGEADEFRGGQSPRDDHVYSLRAVPQDVEDLLVAEPAVRERIGQFVENHHVVVTRRERRDTALPARTGECPV